MQECLNATDHRLTDAAAEARLREYGPNRLPEQPPPALWQIVLRQFYSPLFWILLIAAFVSVFIGDLRDAGFIAAVLVINAIIDSCGQHQTVAGSFWLCRHRSLRPCPGLLGTDVLT